MCHEPVLDEVLSDHSDEDLHENYEEEDRVYESPELDFEDSRGRLWPSHCHFMDSDDSLPGLPTPNGVSYYQ